MFLALSSSRKTPENAALLRETKALLETKQNKLKELASTAQQIPASSSGKK
jgi:hypothetical protein